MAKVGCMPDANLILYVQIILYFAASVLGFFVTVPVGILLKNFDGSCILFAQILQWDRKVLWPWAETSCDYILYMNLAFDIFYATFMGFLMLLVCLKKSDKSPKFVNDWNIGFLLNGFNPVMFAVNVLVAALELCGACVITAGFARFCLLSTQYFDSLPADQKNNAPSSCSGMSSWDGWSEVEAIRGTGKGVNGSNLYASLVIATIASWLLAIVWIIHLILNFGMCCRVCSCEVAEEKRKEGKISRIALRRSRMQTPIGTPGGTHTPLGYGQGYPPQQYARNPPPYQTTYPEKQPIKA